MCFARSAARGALAMLKIGKQQDRRRGNDTAMPSEILRKALSTDGAYGRSRVRGGVKVRL